MIPQKKKMGNPKTNKAPVKPGVNMAQLFDD